MRYLWSAVVLLGLGLAGFAPVWADPIQLGNQATLDAMRLPKGVSELERALENFQRRNYEECTNLLKQARQKQPALLPVRFMLAQLYFLSDLLPDGRAALEQATTENPDHPENYLLWGTVALQEDRTADASVHFEKALALTKAGTWPEQRRRYFLIDCHAGAAAVAERRKDWTAARDLLVAWLEQEPKQADARQRLAAALFHLDQVERAAEELQKAVKDDPNQLPAALVLAKWYTEKKDLKKATEWMETAVKQSPNDSRVLLGYAIWLLDQNRPEEAKTAADAAGRLDADSVDIKVMRGLGAFYLKHYEEAENLLQGVYTESPGDFAASNHLVLALIEQPAAAKRRRALQLGEINARLYPRSSAALATLGWVYFYQGKLAEAEQSLRNALAAGGSSADLYYFLGRVLIERSPRAAEAKQCFKTALETPGRFAFRKEAEEALGRLNKQP